MAGTYDKGDRPRCKAEFKLNSTLTDPSSITFKYKKPDGVSTSLVYGVDSDLKRESTGIYYVDLDINLSGQWFYRFEGTGTVQAASESKFTVRTSEF